MATTIAGFGNTASDNISTHMQAIQDLMASDDPGAPGKLFQEMAEYDNTTTALGDGKKAHEKGNQAVA